MKKRLFGFILAMLLCSQMVFAHPGRLDSNGGHRDKNNVSGLGYYHYHCWGYPAHLHPNGVCPYGVNSGNSSYTTTTTSKPAKKPVNKPATTKTVHFGGNSTKINYVVKNNSTLVELRALSELLNCELGSDSGYTQVSSSSYRLSFKPNKSEILLWNGSNTQPIKATEKPQIINGRAYVPLRFFVENLGYGLSSNTDGTLSINSAEMDKYTPTVPPAAQGKNAQIDNNSNYSIPDTDLVPIAYDFQYKGKVAKVDTVRLNGVDFLNAKQISELLGGDFGSDEKGNVLFVFREFTNSGKQHYYAGNFNYFKNEVYDFVTEKTYETKSPAIKLDGEPYAPLLDYFTVMRLNLNFNEKTKIMEISEDF